MNNLLEKLKMRKRRDSTKANYPGIWRQFNTFVIRLDKKPDSWEERLMLFGAYLVNNGLQSSTLKSYITAIKMVLRDDGYQWDKPQLAVGSLTKACRLVNDRVKTRLPIKIKLLELIIFEIQRLFDSQPFLLCLYKSLFLIAYYGMFRVGELTTGQHPVKAKDVHIATNKDKILLVLYSSKTHNVGSRPQKVKISANDNYKNRFFCPFVAARQYLNECGDYMGDNEPFYIFRDRSPVTPAHVRKILKKTLKSLNLDSSLYGMHSLRIGRSQELIYFGYSLTRLMQAGRWRSNAVFKYIRN